MGEHLWKHMMGSARRSEQSDNPACSRRCGQGSAMPIEETVMLEFLNWSPLSEKSAQFRAWSSQWGLKHSDIVDNKPATYRCAQHLQKGERRWSIPIEYWYFSIVSSLSLCCLSHTHQTSWAQIGLNVNNASRLTYNQFSIYDKFCMGTKHVCHVVTCWSLKYASLHSSVLFFSNTF